MNQEKLTVGREYIIEGKEEYLPPGFGTTPRQRNFSQTGRLVRKEEGRLYFDDFVLHYNGQSDTSEPQLRLYGNIVDRIREVENESGSR